MVAEAESAKSDVEYDRPFVEFFSDLDLDSVPLVVRHAARNVAIDAVACALAGRHSDEIVGIETAAASLGSGSSTLIGGGAASEAAACLINGFLVTAVTLCDIHRPTFCHVSPEVFPPALAIAESEHLSGGDFLTSIIVGLESTVRVGTALNYSEFRPRGWHSPGVSGCVGAAMASGRALALDHSSMGCAVGLAVAQAAGTFGTYGTPAMKFTQGRAAMSGLLSARLASTGFVAPRDALTKADGGLLTTYSDGGDSRALLDGLGERWSLTEIALKRWPVASSILPMATALFDLVGTMEPGSISQVRLGLPSVAYQLHGEMHWDSELFAHLSSRYVAAVIVADGRCWLDQYTDHRRADPTINAFARDHVEVVEIPDLPADSAVVSVRTRDGASATSRMDTWRGSPTDPLDDAELEEKFVLAAEPVLGRSVTADLWSHLISLDEVDDVAEIARLMGRVP